MRAGPLRVICVSARRGSEVGGAAPDQRALRVHLAADRLVLHAELQCVDDDVAEPVHPAVDAGELGVCAEGKLRIVVAEDAEILRDPQPLLFGVFQGADGKDVVGGKDCVDVRVLLPEKMIRDCLDPA